MRRGNLPALRTLALLLALVALVCAPARAFATGTVDARDAQGNGTLGGAEFTVKYYDGYYDSLSGLPATPRRSWVFKTDSAGHAEFDAAHKVSGDELYVNSDNVASMPLGTFSVQETKAPSGYKLTDPSVHLMQLVVNPSTGLPNWKNLDGWNNTNADEDVEGRAVVDQVVRAGVSLTKRDAQGGATAQGDATLSGIEFDIVNISTNKVYVGGVAYEPGEKVAGLLATDAAGAAKTAANALPVGKYRVVESKTNASMRNTSSAQEFEIKETDDGRVLAPTNLVFADEVVRGGVSAQKWSSELGRAEADGDATLAGFVFSVRLAQGNPVNVNGTWYSAGQEVTTITTNASGYAATPSTLLPYGTYTITEKSAPAGYDVNTSWSQTVRVREQGKLVAAAEPCRDAVWRGDLKVQKWSDDLGRAEPDGDATLAGAVLEVVNESAHPVKVDGVERAPGQVVCEIVTDAQGRAQTQSQRLPYGTYRVREKTAPEGYHVNGSWSVVCQVRQKGATYDLTSSPLREKPWRGTLRLGKVELENGGYLPQGASSLEGAKFTVFNKSAHPVVVEGTEYKPDDAVITIVTEETTVNGHPAWVASTPEKALPYGTYEVVEAEASTGQVLNANWSRNFTIRQDGQVVDWTDPTDACPEQVRRGGFHFNKVDEDTMVSVENAVFKVTSVTTGEWHLLVGDENGIHDTEYASHTANTNANDAALKDDGTVDESLIDADSGIWFSGRTDVATDPTDSLGALPYDTYTVEELRTSANEDLRLVTFTVKVLRHNYFLDRGTVDDKGLPSVGTILTYGEEDHVAPSVGTVKLTDTVYYDMLPSGKTYTLTGTLMDASTGEPLTDAKGNPITATKSLKVVGGSGYTKMAFELDAATLAGKTVVAFERMTLDGELVAKHEDLADEDQTVRFPAVGTTLTGNGGHHEVLGTDTLELTDTVDYENVEVGRTYTVVGTLMDAATGKPVEDASGNEVHGACEFRAEQAHGTVEVTFTLDGASARGRTLVAFEKLMRDDTVYAEHADINDQGQTVTVPKAATTLTDDAGDHVMPNIEADITLTDTVSYENLTPGRTYTVTGTLHDKATGEALVDDEGNTITSETDFTPEEAAGTVELTFTFPGSLISGNAAVAFETVSHNGRAVAVHADITDEDQTVRMPEVATTLTSNALTHEAAAATELTLTDTVAYKALLPGRTYTVTGTLHDKATGDALEDAEGNPVTSEVSFKPETADGTVELAFTFDASRLAGSTVVAFETLSDADRELAWHMDLDDEDQSVHIPEVRTTATDAADNDKYVAADGTARISDTVAYSNLEPGVEYVLAGSLHDAATGEPIRDTEGKPVTATSTFTPDKPDGEHVLTFEVDAACVAGKACVVHEVLTRDGVESATHADNNDLLQTVYVPVIGTRAQAPELGHHVFGGDSFDLTDTVEYSALIPGREYKAEAQLVRLGTGEAIEDADGRPITSEATFTPETGTGTFVVTFHDVPAPAEGASYVVFETLKDSDTVVAEHKDATDDAQSVSRVSLRTNATDKQTGTHVGSAEAGATIVDTVTYRGLIPGDTYTLTGTLMDKETGRALDFDGATVTLDLTPTARNGAQEITFTVPAEHSLGRTLVVFETLTRKGADKPIATHTDIKDEAQTVRYPVIATTATDAADNDKFLAAGRVTVKDTVSYKALVPGVPYIMEATLMDATTGEPVRDSEGVAATAKVSFTPDEPTGTVDVEIALDASTLEGHALVAFETLTPEGADTPVATHADLKDAAQTVYVPLIATTATDKASKTHMGFAQAAEKVQITDEVAYHALEPGRAYTVTGILMDKKTGEKLARKDGGDWSAQTEFTPEAADGTVSLTFEVDAKAALGKAIVAFEYLRPSDAETDIATHTDIEDEAQTVRYPKVSTKAKDKASGKNEAPAPTGSVEIVDEVSYEGLEPGVEYTVSGTLMDKETGRALVQLEQSGQVALPDGGLRLESTSKASYAWGPYLNRWKGTFSLTPLAVEKGSWKLTAADGRSATVRVWESTGQGSLAEGSAVTYRVGGDAEKSCYVEIPDGGMMTVTGQITSTGATARSGYLATLVPRGASDTDTSATDGQVPSQRLTFTPKESSGKVELTFTTNATTVSGRSVVVFERLFRDAQAVAAHEDINDKDQTVTYAGPSFASHGPTPKTGDAGMPVAAILAVGGAAAILLATGLWLRRRRA